MNSRRYKKMSGSYQAEDAFLIDLLRTQEDDDTASRAEDSNSLEQASIIQLKPQTQLQPSVNAGNIFIPESNTKIFKCAKLTSNFFLPVDTRQEDLRTRWTPLKRTNAESSGDRENKQLSNTSFGFK